MAHRLCNTQIDNLPGTMKVAYRQYGVEDMNGMIIGISYYNVEDDIEQVLLKELILCGASVPAGIAQ